MTYDKIIFYLAILLAGVTVLIGLTNIITQLVKKIINREEFPAQAIVFLIAEVLTFLTVIIGCTIAGITMYWYFYVVTFILGALVAYGAIFGYDNLYTQLLTAVKNLINVIFKKEDSKND
ncbi:MAG: hypothetical protein PHC95_04990 [Parabacteroides sp.]|nr:hypothetical protein [Parabacteroides sp.]